MAFCFCHHQKSKGQILEISCDVWVIFVYLEEDQASLFQIFSGAKMMKLSKLWHFFLEILLIPLKKSAMTSFQATLGHQVLFSYDLFQISFFFDQESDERWSWRPSVFFFETWCGNIRGAFFLKGDGMKIINSSCTFQVVVLKMFQTWRR